jgi:hypothetical protein
VVRADDAAADDRHIERHVHPPVVRPSADRTLHRRTG